MGNLRGLASSYRSRAEQLRKLAELDNGKLTAQRLFGVADTYEEMAETAEAIEREYHALGHHNEVAFRRNVSLDRNKSPYANTELCAHRHICAFFHSAEEEERALLPFFKDGLERGYKVRRLVDPNLREDYRTRLARAGIDFAEAERNGQFELHDWTTSYLDGGCFDKERMLAWVAKGNQGSKQQAHERVLSVGHMEWALLGGHDCLDDLVEYEARLNDILPKQIVGFCVYDLAKFGGDTIVDIIRTHPAVMIGGILHENPFYVPPDVFLREWRDRHH